MTHPSAPKPGCPVCGSRAFTAAVPVTLNVELHVLGYPGDVHDVSIDVPNLLVPVDAALHQDRNRPCTCTECGTVSPLWQVLAESPEQPHPEIVDFPSPEGGA